MNAVTTPIYEKLDAICRRQQARFLDHLRDTQQVTPRLEGDVSRFMGFVFRDVKGLFHEQSSEAENAHPAPR